jgi:hypothetical protein
LHTNAPYLFIKQTFYEVLEHFALLLIHRYVRNFSKNVQNPHEQFQLSKAYSEPKIPHLMMQNDSQGAFQCQKPANG